MKFNKLFWKTFIFKICVKKGRSISSTTSHSRDKIRRANIRNDVLHMQERHHPLPPVLPSVGDLQRGDEQPERPAREQQSGCARLAQHGRHLPRQVRVSFVRAERHDQDQQSQQVQHTGRSRREREASTRRQSHPLAIHAKSQSFVRRRSNAQLQPQCELL